MRRPLHLLIIALVLAVFMHLDWHLARPHHSALSFDWPLHWLLAIPVFTVLAWHVARTWPERVIGTSAIILVAAAIIAQVLEPLGELVAYKWPLRLSMGGVRLRAFGLFVGVGAVVYALTLAVLLRGRVRRDRTPAV